jgi:hypothetical protein
MLNTCEFRTLFNKSLKNMALPNIMQDFQCDLNIVLLSEGLEGFEVHPSSFDFFQCDLNNVFSS